MKNELLSFVLTSNGDRFANRRLSQEYFVKHDKGHLWEYLFDATKEFGPSYNIRDRLHIIKNGWTPRTCKFCPSPCVLVLSDGNPRMSEFCSAECSHKETTNKKTGRLKVDEVKAAEKRKTTMIQKYGVGHNLQRLDVKEKLKAPKVSDEIHKLLSDDAWLRDQYVTKSRTAVEIAKDLGCFYGTVLDYCRKFEIPISYIRSRSKEETQIIEWLESLGVGTTQSDRTQIPPYEIDIVASVGDKKLGIEVNGLYWHSYDRPETSEERQKHLRKTEACLEKNLGLFHVTDQEWDTKQPIIKSMIVGRLGLSTKVAARKCSVRELTTTEAREFLASTHIQGFVSSKHYFGLTLDNKIVAVLSLGTPRFSKDYEWEITRFASALDTTVVGGFSRLLSFAVETLNPRSILTYADRRFGEGHVYSKNGFQFLKTTDLGYFWTNTKDVIPRYQTQKHKIHRILPNYDPTLSEAQNMFTAKYRRFWDCGNNVYLWERS